MGFDARRCNNFCFLSDDRWALDTAAAFKVWSSIISDDTNGSCGGGIELNNKKVWFEFLLRYLLFSCEGLTPGTLAWPSLKGYTLWGAALNEYFLSATFICGPVEKMKSKPKITELPRALEVRMTARTVNTWS